METAIQSLKINQTCVRAQCSSVCFCDSSVSSFPFICVYMKYHLFEISGLTTTFCINVYCECIIGTFCITLETLPLYHSSDFVLHGVISKICILKKYILLIIFIINPQLTFKVMTIYYIINLLLYILFIIYFIIYNTFSLKKYFFRCITMLSFAAHILPLQCSLFLFSDSFPQTPSPISPHLFNLTAQQSLAPFTTFLLTLQTSSYFLLLHFLCMYISFFFSLPQIWSAALQHRCRCQQSRCCFLLVFLACMVSTGAWCCCHHLTIITLAFTPMPHSCPV